MANRSSNDQRFILRLQVSTRIKEVCDIFFVAMISSKNQRLVLL